MEELLLFPGICFFQHFLDGCLQLLVFSFQLFFRRIVYFDIGVMGFLGSGLYVTWGFFTWMFTTIM